MLNNETMKATSEDFKFYIETIVDLAQNKPIIISEGEKQQLKRAIEAFVKYEQ